MTLHRVSNHRLLLLATMGLTCLVGVVFHPLVGFEFVDLDVRRQVIDNPHIQGLTWENVWHILTSRCVTSYYPVRTLTLALDYQIWGMNPSGFKLTNALLHLVNVLLVFCLALRVLRRRTSNRRVAGELWEVGSSALAAALFAVHPVVVEPVAWVAGREELLMTLGVLACIHLHLTARRLADEDARPRAALLCYAGAAMCCAAACLSSAMAVIVPMLVVAWEALTVDKVTLRRLLRVTGTLWVISLVTVFIKVLGTDSRVLTAEAESVLAMRAMRVVQLYWQNLRTLVWPEDLAVFHQNHPPTSFLDHEVMLGIVAVAISLVILWGLRRRWFVLFGLLWFVIALLPSSQIVTHHVVRADRFLYLPLVGLALALAGGAGSLGYLSTGRRAKAAVIAAGVVIVLALGTRSAVHLRTWKDAVSMWENCLRWYPTCGVAHVGLADNLARRGDCRRALEHYETAMAIYPDSAQILNKMAQFLIEFEDPRYRDYDRALRLATRACESDLEYFPTLVLTHSRYAGWLVEAGEFQSAIEHYQTAIDLHPRCMPALLGLASLLSTCSDEELRNPREAARLAEWARRLQDD